VTSAHCGGTSCKARAAGVPQSRRWYCTKCSRGIGFTRAGPPPCDPRREGGLSGRCPVNLRSRSVDCACRLRPGTRSLSKRPPDSRCGSQKRYRPRDEGVGGDIRAVCIVAMRERNVATSRIMRRSSGRAGRSSRRFRWPTHPIGTVCPAVVRAANRRAVASRSRHCARSSAARLFLWPCESGGAVMAPSRGIPRGIDSTGDTGNGTES